MMTCILVSRFSPISRAARNTHAQAPRSCCRSTLALISITQLIATLKNVKAADYVDGVSVRSERKHDNDFFSSFYQNLAALRHGGFQFDALQLFAIGDDGFAKHGGAPFPDFLSAAK